MIRVCREIEVVLDSLDEFVFNCGGVLSSSGSSSSKQQHQQQEPLVYAFVELEMIQTLYEFFSHPAEKSILVTAFVFLFMEPLKPPKGGGDISNVGEFHRLALREGHPAHRRMLVFNFLCQDFLRII